MMGARSEGMTGKRLRTVAGLLACVITVAQALSASAAESCITADEETAFNTRVLQSELMVSALSCANRANYNAFVKKFQNVLVEWGKLLQASYRRQYGPSGTERMNSFVTRLANEASIRSRADIGFCAQTSLIFTEAYDTDPDHFERLLDKAWLRNRHGVPRCGEARGVVSVGYGAASGPSTIEPRR